MSAQGRPIRRPTYRLFINNLLNRVLLLTKNGYRPNARYRTRIIYTKLTRIFKQGSTRAHRHHKKMKNVVLYGTSTPISNQIDSRSIISKQEEKTPSWSSSTSPGPITLPPK